MQAWNEAIGAMVMAPLQATARFVATLKSYASGTPTAHKLGGLLYADVSHTMEELVRALCVLSVLQPHMWWGQLRPRRAYAISL